MIGGLNLLRYVDGESVVHRADARTKVAGLTVLVFVLSFPAIDEAIKASVALSKMTGIAFRTSPAVTIAEFDKLMGDL